MAKGYNRQGYTVSSIRKAIVRKFVSDGDMTGKAGVLRLCRGEKNCVRWTHVEKCPDRLYVYSAE